MKIGTPADKSLVAPATTERKEPAKDTASARSGAATLASSKVRLSPTVSGLLAGEDPKAVFDAAKVESMTTTIVQGKFTADPAKIADKLIANAQELLGKKSS